MALTAPTSGGGSGTAAEGTAAAATSSVQTGPQGIWNALVSAGASAVQAAGIMGNMIAESSLNPESVNPADSNGYASYGLCQWNAASYPTASSLVTGHPVQDIIAQVNLLTTSGGLQAASGTTVSECASNFAANYERCSTCEPGGAQNSSRVANAQQVAGWAASGNWPSSSSQGTATATLTSAELTAAETSASDCLWGISYGSAPGLGFIAGIAEGLATGGAGGSSGSVCIVSKSQARSVTGVGLMVGGISVMAAGLLLLGSQAGLAIASPLIEGIAKPAQLAARVSGIPRAVRTGRT